jgi:hypothetical protein
MFRTISIKFCTVNSAVSVVAAALVAGMAVFLIPVAPEARATASHLAKADRLPVVAKEMACSMTSWPNYERNCQFDLRTSSGESRSVRIIALR